MKQISKRRVANRMNTEITPTRTVEAPNRRAAKAQGLLAFHSPLRELIDRGIVTEDDAAWSWTVDADLYETRFSTGQRHLWAILEMWGELSLHLPHLDIRSRIAVRESLRPLFADLDEIEVDEVDDLDVPLVPVADGETFVGGAA